MRLQDATHSASARLSGDSAAKAHDPQLSEVLAVRTAAEHRWIGARSPCQNVMLQGLPQAQRLSSESHMAGHAHSKNKFGKLLSTL